jgi:ADP-heptose:LPS heptosyltransferase
LGDLVQAIPLLRAIKQWNPAAHLTVFARPACSELLLRLPYVSEVELAEVPWIRPDSGSLRNLFSCLELARYLRGRSYDLAIDLRYHNRLDSLLLSLSGARFRLGFDAGGLGFWLTHRAPWPRSGHETERGAQALACFGISVEDTIPSVPVTDAELQRAALWLAPRPGGRGGPIVTIHVGAGNAVKRWMPERFAWVARGLIRRANARIAVLAGPGEELQGDPLVESVPARAIVDLRGKLNLGEMAAVMKLSALFIGNDSGPAHMSAASGSPSLVIFSGTNTAEQWAPRGAFVHVIEKWVPCKPCGRTDCPYEQACLRKVTADEVLDQACAMLAGREDADPKSLRAGCSAGYAQKSGLAVQPDLHDNTQNGAE